MAGRGRSHVRGDTKLPRVLFGTEGRGLHEGPERNHL